MPRKKRSQPPKPEGKQRLRLLCYCCGAELGNEIALAAPVMEPSRVFTMLPEHATRVEGVYEIVCRDVRIHKHLTEGTC